jgi:hypothetical protein
MPAHHSKQVRMDTDWRRGRFVGGMAFNVAVIKGQYRTPTQFLAASMSVAVPINARFMPPHESSTGLGDQARNAT